MTLDEIRVAIKGSKKLPKCVAVYDKLFKLIKEGEFDEDNRLPTEPELAKIMGVSRMTLRQALALLQEDGIIQNIHGKGNFITQKQRHYERGLESLSHPVYLALDDKISEVEIDFNIGEPSDYVCEALGVKPEAVVMVDRWYKNGDEALSYTLTFLSIETVKDENIDLEKKRSLLEFLEKTCYEKAKHSTLNINFSTAGNFTAMKYTISKSKKFWLLEESIVLKVGAPVIYNKHYIPMEGGHISIERK